MSVSIIDYGSGNLRSVLKAFEHVGAAANIISDSKQISGSSHIVLPGVGAYADCMNGLKALPGMVDTLCEAVLIKKRNFLGICVGMQMMFERGFEHGEHKGLGWLKGDVVKLAPADGSRKIPHMGWNDLIVQKSHPVLRGIESGAHAYFVHSYHATAQRDDLLVTTDYAGAVAAVVGREHMVGSQFHPEKSQETGLALLKNFVGM